MAHSLLSFDSNDQIKVILIKLLNYFKVMVILSKVENAFCAGANIKEFTSANFSGLIKDESIFEVEKVFSKVKKPVISGVNGFALGGGLEIALLSDILVASEDAKFGLPELK